ncbi:extracellular solute-binding protein [Halobacillus andaensis]|uniref:extracellular solute-binding protein n=1 Tax=Halobacillus andaensis TaxID=1176239 RepID=UPI003D75A902
MKKTIITGITCLMLAGAAGCSGEDSSANDQDTLTWLTTSGYSPEAPSEGTADYISEKVQKFEETHPDMNMKISLQSSNIDEAMARLLEQANTGRAPDMAAIDGYMLDRYMEYLQPLDELMEDRGLEPDDFLPFAEEVIRGEDGQIYGLYMSTDTRMLYYNKEVIEEPPETWEEVIEVSKEVQKEGYQGLVLPVGIGEGTTVTSILPLFWSQGGELVDEAGNPSFGKGKNREAMIKTFDTLYRAREEGAISKRMASSGQENDANGEVAAGNTAMFLGGSWQAATIEETLGDDFENWEVASLPMIEEGDETASSAGGWAWGIFAEDPEKQEAAFDFLMDSFISEQGMGEFTSLQGSLPARESVYDSEYYDPGPFNDEFLESLETEARARPGAPSYNEISVQLQTSISQVISGSKEPEQAVDDAWEIVTFGESEDDK